MAVFQVVLFSFLFAGVVACEGTIEFGEDSEYQHVALTPEDPVDGKADNIEQPEQTTSAADEGAALYLQYCSACHGADATGSPTFEGSIVGFQPIAPVVQNGQGLMAPVAISDEQIDAIQSFLLADSQAEPVAEPVGDGTSPGIQKFATNCAVCHGAEGEGTPNGPQIRFRDPGLAKFTIRQGRNGPGNPSVMPTYASDAISDVELDEMISWLDSMPNPADGEGLYNRYCANCHGPDGLGGPAFEPLVGRTRAGSIVREGHGDEGAYADRREYMSGWTPDQLSDDEILKIEEYMRTL